MQLKHCLVCFIFIHPLFSIPCSLHPVSILHLVCLWPHQNEWSKSIERGTNLFSTIYYPAVRHKALKKFH